MSCNIEDLDPSEIIFGCTDPAAINYNSSATVDDGTCIISGSTILGCIDPLALNYSSGATEDNGSCIYELCPTGITVVENIVYYTDLLQPGQESLYFKFPLNEDCCTEELVGEQVLWDSTLGRCKIDLKTECIVYSISLDGVALNQNGQAISEECCTSLGTDYQWDQNVEYKGKKGGCVYTNYVTEECNLELSNLTFNEDGTIDINLNSFTTGSTSTTTDTTTNEDVCVNIDHWYVYNLWPQGDSILGYPEGSLLILHTTDNNAIDLQVGQQIALSGMDIVPISQTCYNYTELTTLNLITKILKIIFVPDFNTYEIVTSVYFSTQPGEYYNNLCLDNINVAGSGKACVVYGQPEETITQTNICVNFSEYIVNNDVTVNTTLCEFNSEPSGLFDKFIILKTNNPEILNFPLCQNYTFNQFNIFDDDNLYFNLWDNTNTPPVKNDLQNSIPLKLVKVTPSSSGYKAYFWYDDFPNYDPFYFINNIPKDINDQTCYNKVTYTPVVNTQASGSGLGFFDFNIDITKPLDTILSNLTLNETCCLELGQGLWSWIDGRCYWKPPKLPETVSIGVSENDIIVTDSECTTLRVCLSFFLERPDNPECEPIGDVTANLNVYSGNTVDSGSLENIINVSQVSNYSLVRDGYCQWVQVCADITGFEGVPFKLKLDLQGVLDCCDYEIYLDDISVNCTIQDSIVVPNRLECPGFTIRRVIDNKKSWVYNDGEVINRIFAPSPDADIPWRYTNYFDQSGVYERHSKLVLNSKEMEITFNMCSGANCDPKLNVYELIDYKKNFQNFWIKFIEQFIPATTIFVAGERWCTTEDQICPVIEPCAYDNKFELSDLGIFNTSGDSEKPGDKQNNGSNVPVYISETKVPENKSGDYGSNKNDGPLIFDNFVGSFIKPDTSTLVNKELTLPRGLLPLLETGMNNFRSKMVPTVYIQM